MSSPDPSTKKENQRKSKKENKPKGDKKKAGAKKEDNKSGSDMTKLDNLPGFGKPSAQPKFQQQEDSGGFDDFDFEEDHIGDSSNKYSDAEKHLREF